MIKCFLSHSSDDKDSYVRPLANKLRSEKTVLDEKTFEHGMLTIEEISNGLNETSLFVILISESALNSNWVQNEIDAAKTLLSEKKLDRIYPIIIDEKIKHNDPRIPQWMRDSLNIQPIFNVGVAARKINARLTEISWDYHPRLKEKRELFVGRHTQVKQIEERLDDFSRATPSALIASGLNSIGRKSLLQYSMRRANIVRTSYEFPAIHMSQYDGIEDFILKLADLGITRLDSIHERASGSFEEKIELAKELLRELISEKERVLIEDNGAIITLSGEPVDWFSEVMREASREEYVAFIIASKFRLSPRVGRERPEYYGISVGEMDASERSGLLGRYTKFEDLHLDRETLSFFADILSGYPEQVFFAVNLIRDEGVLKAKKASHTIQQYASDKAKVVLDGFKDDQDTLDLIYLISKFEFISYEVLFDVANEEKYFPILDNLLSSSVCERMGTSADYVRVNEAIRDYVSRNRFGLPTKFDEALKKHVNSFVERYSDDNADISDYLYSAQEVLRSGKEIPSDLIIPSVFIKTIKKLYEEDKNYQDACSLADRILLREKTLHEQTIAHIRFIKCQCLARMKRADFFDEVRKVKEPDRWFLYGFNYRLSGNFVKAEENLKRVLANGRRDPRTLGELVLVYMQSEEYALAFEIARENYRNRKYNPINANNYFTCLIMREKTPENRIELEQIISGLEIDKSEKAQEMLYSAKAKMLAIYQGDEAGSMEVIEEAIGKFPKVHYPILTKADLAIQFRNKPKLNEAVALLEKIVGKNAQTYRTFIRFKAQLQAMEGDLHLAKLLVEKELKWLNDSSKRKLVEKLELLTAEAKNGKP